MQLILIIQYTTIYLVCKRFLYGFMNMENEWYLCKIRMCIKKACKETKGSLYKQIKKKSSIYFISSLTLVAQLFYP